MDQPIHMTKERKGPIFTSKCGVESKRVMTIWWRDVTCPACLTAMGQPSATSATPPPTERTKKVIRRMPR
jgi:hypothetical protein